MKNPKIKNIKTKVLSDNWYILNKVDFDYQLRSGRWVHQSRESYDRGNGAAILLYNTDKNTVVLIRQLRIPTYFNGNESGMIIEVCAGLLDGDDPVTCIIKETEEETGYRIQNVKKIFESYMSPGAVTEIIHFFIGEYDQTMKVSYGGGLDSEHEDIEILELDFQEALGMIKNGEIKDAKTILLLQHAQINGILK